MSDRQFAKKSLINFEVQGIQPQNNHTVNLKRVSENGKKSRRSPLDEAITLLNQLAIPKNIPCRENEKQFIKQFIEKGIQTLGCSQILYISGVPGIGKTISVLQVMEKMRCGQKVVQDCIQININAMNLTRPQNIYSSILYQLTNYKQKNTMKALSVLNDIFQSGIVPLKLISEFETKQQQKKLKENVSKIKIIFIDELDYLNTKTQQVLYNLFEWPKSKHSKIVMLTVSNTIDFPERIEQKIVSRIGNQRLVFRPYTSQQIQIIVKQRIEAVNIFEENAISYACKKIAKFSSDIRKSLSVLRSAVQIFKARKFPNRYQKISLEYISEAHRNTYNDPIIKSLAMMPLVIKKVIIKICFQIHLSGKGCWFSELWHRVKIGVKQIKNETQLLQIILLIKEINLIRIKTCNRHNDNRIEKTISIYSHIQDMFIELQIDIDQIFNALSEEETLINEIELMKVKKIEN